MKKIPATIESDFFGFIAYTDDFEFFGSGGTMREAKTVLKEQMLLYRDKCREEGSHYPAYLDKKFEIAEKMDVQKFLLYYSDILNLGRLKCLSWIDRDKLSSFADGSSKPTEAEARKIETAIHRLGRELLSVAIG